VSFLPRKVDRIVGGQPVESMTNYRFLICELGPHLRSPARLLAALRSDAHVALILPTLDVRLIAHHMRDERVNHLMLRSGTCEAVQSVAEKLESGAIFGLERYLPPSVSINYRRLRTYEDRCEALEDLARDLQERRLRGSLRRAAAQAAEELLMNAMYQAPVDEEGNRLFRDIAPSDRIHHPTPRPVSFRFAVHGKTVYLSVRDRFGSFQRADLHRCLSRCVRSQAQIEDKKLGAGLGLYLVTSTVTKLVINIMPGRLAEFICVLDRPSQEAAGIQLLSVTTADDGRRI